MPTLTILDGPMGTELLARGVPTPLPEWSARALLTRPEVVRAIHEDYAEAGARVHTANTFRTKRRVYPRLWRGLVLKAVALAREAVPGDHRIAGSLSPLEDCYSPWLSPEDPRPEHREMAQALAGAGVDLLLVETFPHVGEAWVATEEAVASGIETWVSFTAGPGTGLLNVEEMTEGARGAAERGASALLVNCVPASRTLPFLQALEGTGLPFGAYANAGQEEEGMGWKPGTLHASRYADLAEAWVEAGATLLGSCCGTGVAHIRELCRRFGGS